MNFMEAPGTRPLNRSTALARELVHRTALAEVLLTDVRPEQGDTFTAAAQWARSHPTFDRTGDGRHNPLLVVETMRQLGICIPLEHYAVPRDWHFLIEELRFTLDPATEPRAKYGGTEITCEVQAEPMAAKPGHGPSHEPDGRTAPMLQRLRLNVCYLAAGREFAQADGIARFLTPKAYAAVRNRRPAFEGSKASTTVEPTAPDPAKVGVPSGPDLLIALTPDGRTLVQPADPYHPFFFDHLSDHIPGMVLIEAVRQAAAWQAGRPGWRIAACALRALCFTEPQPPAEIVCTIDGPVADFEVRQFGNQTAAGTLQFAR